jgi:hypothetical protein
MRRRALRPRKPCAISAKRGRRWSEQDLFALLSLFAQRASVEMSEDERRDDD